MSKLIEINGIEDITEAVDIVSDAVKHEPIFSKAELSDFNLIREDVDALIAEEEDNTLEDLVADVYQALPTDLQLTIAEGYNTVVERYSPTKILLSLFCIRKEIIAKELRKEIIEK